MASSPKVLGGVAVRDVSAVDAVAPSCGVHANVSMSETMRKIARLIRWCLTIIIVPMILHGRVGASDVDPALRDALAELKQLYATEITLGRPLEIDGFKIIPLAMVGIGYGQRAATPDGEAVQGAGGVVSPVGVLVVSQQGVQLLPVSKGLLEQVLGAVTPIVLQVMQRGRKEPAGVAEPSRARISIPEILATLYAFMPARGWKFGFFPWPLPLVLLFLAGWLVLALLVALLLPHHITVVAATLQTSALRAGLIGLLSYGVVFVLAAVFTISIIGIPLTVLLLVLTWGAKLLGTVSIAWLIGQKTAAAVRPRPYSEVIHVLIGGLMLGAVRIIPVLGWILWLILGIVGLGAVLRSQMQR
jgi:uncharacterized spore protein YtfJ